jgi:hypothetical protein
VHERLALAAGDRLIAVAHRIVRHDGTVLITGGGCLANDVTDTAEVLR